MKRGKFAIVFLLIPFALAVVSGVSSITEAADVPWVKPPPTIEQLTHGKVHTGERITATNVDLVAPYLLQSFVQDIKDGAVITIAPSTPANQLLPKCMIDATEKNAGKARISAQGTVTTKDGKPWIGGFPAEFPTTALEVMVNQGYQYADQDYDIGDELWISPRGETYKVVTAQLGEYYMNGRACVRPFGVVPGYEGELVRDYILDLAPYDVRGIAILSIIYQDQTKLPDSWGYIPVLRRVQRLSSAQRYDSIDGSDLRAGDLNGFSDPLSFWSFKILAHKPMLFPISPGYPHIKKGRSNLKLIKGKYLAGMSMEVRDVYLIEAVPRVNYIYSKKILEIDSGTYLSIGDFYDKQGKLWIGFEPVFTPWQSSVGASIWPIVYVYRNYQTGSATFSPMWMWKFDDPSENPDMFSLRYIMTQSR